MNFFGYAPVNMLSAPHKPSKGMAMRKRVVAGVAGALAAISIVAAPAASAATEFGDGCVANQAAEGLTLVSLASPNSGLPNTAPSAGVITQWRINLIAEVPFTIPQTLKVLRTTAPATVQVVGESPSQQVAGGSNTYSARIPIQAGDRLGLFGSSPEIGTLYCSPGSSEDIAGVVSGNASIGSSSSFLEENEIRVPAIAVVEPDADNDGFGDETQDKCPQNATIQAACPAPVALGTSSAVKKGLVTVLITSSAQAPVTVTGTVRLGKGKAATLNGGTQIVAPGALVKFTLLFPKALRSKLKQIRPKRSLSLNLTATAPNLIGPPTVSSLVAKLKGQAVPKPKHKAKAKAKAKDQA